MDGGRGVEENREDVDDRGADLDATESRSAFVIIRVTSFVQIPLDPYQLSSRICAKFGHLGHLPPRKRFPPFPLLGMMRK